MFDSFLVGYDVTFNTYEWYRPPKLHKNIILDNHDVAIEAYNDTYISEGMIIKEQEIEYIEI